MKNRYGITPWGSWFIDVLDSYQMGERLNRGRRYANAGRVLSLEFVAGSPSVMARAVAKVEGNYLPYYRVEISFPPLKEAEQVYRMIEEDPPLLACIAAGELPEVFLQKLKKKGINLIPRRWRDMKRSCTCPDWGDPCKHMAALYYIIAREIDADPHVLFKLRGMDLKARFGEAVVHIIEPPFTITFTPSGSSRAASALAVSQAGPRVGPEAASPGQIPLHLEAIPHCGDLISSLLPPAPPFCSRDFTQVMAEFYHRCVRDYHQSWESAEINEQTLAETEHKFSRSHWTVICSDPGPGAKPILQAEDINGKTKLFSLFKAFELFVHFSSEDGTESYSFLFYLFKFLNLICASGAFIPYVFTEDGTFRIVWRPFETLPPVPQILQAIASRECGMYTLKRIRQKGRLIGPTVSGRSVVDLLASAFLGEWVKQRFIVFRGNIGGSLGGQSGGDEYRELLNLFFDETIINVSAPAWRSLPAAIDRWLSVLHIDFTAYRYSITVKDLSRNKESSPEDDPGGLYFALSMDVLTEHEEGVSKIPISKCRDLEMLRAPTALSNYLPEIRELASPSKTARSVRLSEARLVSFLDSASSLLTRLGITVNLPKALHKELKPRLVIKGSSTGALVSYLNLDVLQEFKWQVAIGDKVLTLAEFEKLLKQKHALVRFRDGFVKMDPEEFARLLKRAKDAAPGFNDFLKAHFTGDTILAFDVNETINNLFKEQNFPIPKALNAQLRPYQKRGYNWVWSLLFSGFGCILADDMGLGKTIQSIATLLRLKDEGLLGNGCLVVAPASLLNNWEKELGRFAPSLGISRYHGNRRHLDRKQDVYLTTYQTAARDAEKLMKETFSLLLVDEAHLMKNAETNISRAVKQLRSQYRLALSGTPVENRLEDLRSLFDFILPGYLGNTEMFRKLYRIPIEVMRDRGQAENLRKITAPFLLRRLKTDKTIIKDLPDKIVTNEYAVLEKGQAALYESVVSESIRK
ncbi:MAG: DEAD/DEAH box helicase family protein, partial [Treponema sp.]|nr:DEAD/DEAH box helicase family protein [Treponema sp.]